MKCDYCYESINASSEIATGLCDRHRSLLESKKYYTGICWNCNRITIIDEIPHRLEQVFKDKYLFTAACSQCSGNPLDDIKWVTFNRFKPRHRMTVGEDGKIRKEMNESPPEEVASSVKPTLTELSDTFNREEKYE